MNDSPSSNREVHGDKSDDWVAGNVRMLSRTSVDHEAICVAARDRIKRLAKRVAELEAHCEDVEQAAMQANARARAAVEPVAPSSKRSTYAELMKIAAELARGDGIASDCDEDHPTRMTRQHWMTHLERAHAASKDRAVRLRRLIDQLCADEPKATLTDDEIAAIGSTLPNFRALPDYLDDDRWNNVEAELLSFARAIERAVRATVPPAGNWYTAEDIDRLVRELDMLLNGDGAAPQALLCDLVAQVRRTCERIGLPIARAAETKRGSVPCIWRNGCDGKRNCQEAGCCLGSREERGEPDETRGYQCSVCERSLDATNAWNRNGVILCGEHYRAAQSEEASHD